MKIGFIVAAVLVLFLPISGAVTYYQIGDSGKQDIYFLSLFITLIVAIVVGALIVSFKNGLYDFIAGHISMESYQSFIKKNHDLPFVLYLRSFDTDINSADRSQAKKLSQGFSEYKIAKELRKHNIGCYAVGITSELDSPYGANRLYCSFENWQEEVSDLIRKADFIFIVADKRDSCIWEMETTRDLESSKPVLYYFLSEKHLKEVTEKVHFPTPPRKLKFPCYLYNDQYISFNNNRYSYSAIVSRIIAASIMDTTTSTE